ncbi:hypothetical protein D3C78_1297510 [compost metagenome]
MRGVAAQQQCLGGQVKSGGERHRAQLAADLLGHHAQFQGAEADAAGVLRQHQGGDAHVHQPLPDRAAVAVSLFQDPAGFAER